jgi:hypothetical protein
VTVEVDLPRMTEAQAEEITDSIRTISGEIAERFVDLADLVARARDGRADVALGFASWPVYLAETVGTIHTETRDERRVLAQYLTEQGLSTRAIAPILGVGKSTIDRDVGAGVPYGTPDVIDADPEPITGLDGKSYPRPKPAPEPTPEEVAAKRAETDAYWAEDAKQKATRAVRLAVAYLVNLGYLDDLVERLPGEPLPPTVDEMRTASTTLATIAERVES